MSSRERRLLDKDIEIRKLQGELKHYKTCFFSCVFEKDRTRKALDLAVDTLKKAETTRELTVKGHYVHAISLDELHSALKEIKQLIKGE